MMIRKMALMDWRAMKYYHIRGILLPIFAAFVGFSLSPVMVLPTMILLSLFFSLNPFAVEEKGELNNLYLTLPVNRDTIVSGRFLLTGVFGLSGLIIGIPIMIIVNAIGWSHYFLPLSWYIFILAFSYFMFALLNLATYPILFKLGYNKGKFWGLVLPAIFMGLLYGIFTAITDLSENESLLFNILKYANENMFLISGGLVLMASLILIISFTASKRVYSKREF